MVLVCNMLYMDGWILVLLTLICFADNVAFLSIFSRVTLYLDVAGVDQSRLYCCQGKVAGLRPCPDML